MGKLNVSIAIDMFTDGAPSETAVSETVELTLPRLNSKYIQIPKVLEGVFEQLAERHNQRVTAWEVRAEREAAERRRRPQLWDSYAEPVRQPTAAELAATFGAQDAAPILDGRALLEATDAQVDAAVAEAVATWALPQEVSDGE